MNPETTDNLIRSWLEISPEYAIKYVGFSSGLPVAILAILIAAAAALTIFLYVRQGGLSSGQRVALAGLRIVVYTLILVILFGPVLGLERRVKIRRNLLVLVDRSESMGIADVRSKPRDLTDAALSLGRTSFALPEAQESLARVRRAMQRSVRALREGRGQDVLEGQGLIERSLKAAMEDLRSAAAGGDKAVAGRIAQATEALGELAGQQKGLRNSCVKLEREGSLSAERCRERSPQQEALLARLGKLTADLAQLHTPVAGATKSLTGLSRMSMARGLLTHPKLPVLDRLSDQLKVRRYFFGEKLEPTGTEGATTATTQATQPMAKSSRGAEAIKEAVTRFSGQSIAGMVLLTDGAFNDEGADPQEAAAWLEQQDVPLYVVGLGLEAPQDIGLRSLIVQDVFFPKDKVTARMQVFSHGYAGTAVDVRALLNGTEMAKQVIQLTDHPQFIELSFKVPEGAGGPAKLAVTVSSRPGEASTANNRIERTVRIIDEKIKVLYVEGKPRWEYRYLRVVLLRDPRLDVKFLMTQGDPDLAKASEQYLAHYPEKAEEAFKYDLVILGDVPAWYFNRGQLERMVQLIRERGGSLLMLSGDRYAPASYVETPIADVLPVRITRDHMQVADSVYPVPTETGKRSFVMMESSDEANNAVWSLVKPMYRLPRLKGAKPAANVMLQLPPAGEGAEGYPLAAWHYVGTGKVMYVGTDQLWRLRFKRGDHYHAQFWGQAIQFLTLSRLLGENKRIRLEADQTEVRAGRPVEITAYVLDESFQPIKAKQYTVHCDRLAGQTAAARKDHVVTDTQIVKLTAVASTQGLFQGVFTPSQEGRYVLRTPSADKRFSNTLTITVASANREQQEPAMQGGLLRKMAELSGGRYLTMAEWPALAGSFDGKQRTITERKEMPLLDWADWPTYVVLVLCLCAEWFLRRRYHLV